LKLDKIKMKLNQLKIKTLISTALITLMPKEVFSQINRIYIGKFFRFEPDMSRKNTK